MWLSSPEFTDDRIARIGLFGGPCPRKVEMNEFEQLQVAEAPLQEFDVDFPGTRRRRMIIGLVSLVVLAVLVASAVLFVDMNNRIHSLDRTTTAQSRQIRQLQSDITSVNASLGAAVACLQTVGSSQGLCSKLVK